MSDWQFLKNRTAADGAVWRSADDQLYLRTGGVWVLAEAQHQRDLAEAGYPVPEITETGTSDEDCYFIERTAGTASLHELAITDTARAGRVSDEVLTQAVGISTRLLQAQARNPLTACATEPEWFQRAGFAADVRKENPDLDTPESTTRSPAR